MTDAANRRAAIIWSMLSTSIRIGLATAALLAGTSALAVAESIHFDIPPQPMPSALRAFAAQSQMQLLYVHSEVARAQGRWRASHRRRGAFLPP